jgi:hypothetical protein
MGALSPPRDELADRRKPKSGGSWRDTITIHPVADAFPMLGDDNLAELGKDIEANGLRHQIVLWRDNTAGPDQDAPLYLIDGRNRLEAMERGGLTIPTVEEDRVAIERVSRSSAFSRSSMPGGGRRQSPTPSGRGSRTQTRHRS